MAAQDSDAWLLSVTGLGDALLVVGGQPGRPGAPGRGFLTTLRGRPPVVTLRQPSPTPGMLWWVHSVDDRSAWAVGEGGALVRYQDGQARTLTPPTSATLYGVWAFSDDEVWAVGGTEGQPGVILRGGVQGFTIDSSAPRTGTLLKVFGAAPGRLFVVGASGVMLRRQDGVWRQDPPLIPSNEILFGVHGVSDPAAPLGLRVYAVGGVGQGRLVAYQAGGPVLLPTPGLNALTGVWAAASGALL